MTNAIAWNTGRGYTDKGQRIAARVIGRDEFGDALVAMVDIDRDIDGVYVTVCAPEPTRADILRAYDADMRATHHLRESLAVDTSYTAPIWADLRAAAAGA